MSLLQEAHEPGITIEIDTDQKSKNLEETKKIEAESKRRVPQTTGNRHDTSNYETILAAYFPPKAVNEAERVIKCESGGRASVISPTKDYGLFQVNKAAHEKNLKKYGKTIDDMLNAEDNIWYASLLYKENGWQPWYMSRNCHKLI